MWGWGEGDRSLTPSLLCMFAQLGNKMRNLKSMTVSGSFVCIWAWVCGWEERRDISPTCKELTSKCTVLTADSSQASESVHFTDACVAFSAQKIYKWWKRHGLEAHREKSESEILTSTLEWRCSTGPGFRTEWDCRNCSISRRNRWLKNTASACLTPHPIPPHI